MSLRQHGTFHLWYFPSIVRRFCACLAGTRKNDVQTLKEDPMSHRDHIIANCSTLNRSASCFRTLTCRSNSTACMSFCPREGKTTYNKDQVPCCRRRTHCQRKSYI